MIVEFFEKFVNKKNEDKECFDCWRFIFARKDYANVSVVDCCTTFILEWYKLSVRKDSDGDIKYRDYQYRVFIGVNSDFTNQYYNEIDSADVSNSKYIKYIKRIEMCITDSFEINKCTDIFEKILDWSFEPKINNFDNNLDGGYLTGTIRFINSDNL